MPKSIRPISIDWIPALAEPYLRGYKPVPQASGALRGYWLLHPGCSPRSTTQAGFFVGYLVGAQGFNFLGPEAPECIVFAFVRPVKGALHRRLVGAKGSLVRKTFEYIRWLTHRLPRFAFFEDQLPAMVRRVSMQDWPRGKYEHFSRNFFIETMAWLVRSGLVRRFAAQRLRPVAAAQRRIAV